MVSTVPFLRTPPAFVAMFLVGYFLLCRLRHWRIGRGPETLAIVFIAGCVVVTMIELMWSPESTPVQSILVLMSWVQLVILYVVFTDVCRSPAGHVSLWLAFVGAMTFMALMAHFKVGGALIGTGIDDRIGYEGVNLNRQAFGYALALVTVVWYAIHFWKRSWLSVIVPTVLIFILAGSLLAAGSRTGFIAFLAGISGILFLEFRKRTASAYFMIVPAILLFLVWALFETPLILNRLDSAITGEQTGGRDVLIAGAWELTKMKPLFGWGVAAPQTLASHIGWSGRSVDAHNTHLQIAMRFGLIVYFIWVLFVSSILRRCWKGRRNRWCRLFFVLTVMTLAFSVTGSLATNLYFWVVTAAASQAHRLPDDVFGKKRPAIRRNRLWSASVA